MPSKIAKTKTNNMFDFKKHLIQISGLLLTLTAVSPLPTVSVSIAPAVAQTSNNSANDLPLPESLLPKSLPKGKTVKVYGSTSMTVPNRALKKRWEEKYPGTKVEVLTTTSDKALEVLQSGKTDLAAVGRPLTNQEKAKGLVLVPVKREKIAIIVGAGNPFKKDLTFEQFSKIFRGEITDWSQVGGPPGKIRFIDRPVSSDTRLALSTYDVFKKAPFKIGSSAIQLPKDDSAAVVQTLGNDGISYAIADQIANLKNIRVVKMHNTLPTDPRYPYSQLRGYVYKKGAFLIVAPPPQPAPKPAPTPPPPQPVAEKDVCFPWWLPLLLLLGIPLVGALLWLLLKRKPVQSTILKVHADWGNDENEMNHLPSYQNPYDKPITVKVEAEGKWTYGAPDASNKFDLQVTGDGNKEMAEKESKDNDMRFKDKVPAALVALKNGQVVGNGKGPYELKLNPHETVSFVINDEPGFYKDNTGTLTVKLLVVK